MELGWVHHVKHFVCKLKLANCEATNKRITEAANEMLRKKLTYRLLFISQTAYYRAFSMVFEEFQHRPAAWKHPKSLSTDANINWTMNEIERKYFHLINSIWIGLKFPSPRIQRICCVRWMFTQKEISISTFRFRFSVACVCIKFHLLVFITIAIVYTLSFNHFGHGSNHTF